MARCSACLHPHLGYTTDSAPCLVLKPRHHPALPVAMSRRQHLEALEAERDQAGFHLPEAHEELEALNATMGTKAPPPPAAARGLRGRAGDERSAAFLKACHIQKTAGAADHEQIASQHFTGNPGEFRWWPPAARRRQERTLRPAPPVFPAHADPVRQGAEAGP